MVKFVENEHTYSCNLDNGPYFEAGSTVSGTYRLNEGYTLVRAEVVDHPDIEVEIYDSDVVRNEYSFRFDMPEDNVEINFVTKKLVDIIYDDELINVNFVGETELVNNQLIEGETYEFTLTAAPGKKIISDPKLTSEIDGVISNIEWTQREENGQVIYSFVAPSNAVTISVETENMPSHIISFDFSDIEGYSPSYYLGNPTLSNSVGDSVYSGDEVFVGDTLTIEKFYPDSYTDELYSFDGIYLAYNGESHKIHGESFVVPDYDFSVEIRFTKLPTNILTFDVPEGVEITVYAAKSEQSYWYSSYEIEEREDNKYEFLNDMYLHVKFALSNGYEANMLDLSSLKVLLGNEEVDVGATTEKVDSFEFTLGPLSNQNISVSLGALSEKEMYTISIADDELSQKLTIREQFDVYSSEIDLSEKQLPGTTLFACFDDLTYSDFSENDYFVQVWTADGTQMLEEIRILDKGGYYDSYYAAEFDVPEQDFMIKLVNKAAA